MLGHSYLIYLGTILIYGAPAQLTNKLMKIKKLNLKLKHGEIVIFENEREKIGIGGSGKDENGDYRHSSWHKSIEEVLQNIGCSVGYTQKQLKEHLKTWKYIKSIPWALSDPIPEEQKY